MVGLTWLGEYQEDGVVYFRLGREGDELVAEWPNIATLRANPKRGTSRFDADPSADPVLVEKVHRSLAQALLRHLEHKLTLHGSAVTDPKSGRAVAIVGSSGAGKSTLAAALAREEGLAFAADDTLAIEMPEGVIVPTLLPTERESWLLADVCEHFGVPPGDDKQAVAPPRLASAARLVAVVLPAFGEGEEIRLSRMRGQSLLSALVPAVVRFVIDDPRVQLREIEQLSRLTDMVPVISLTRPRDLSRLGETLRVVRALLDEPQEAS